MVGRLSSINLKQRDYEIFRDIYEFYYMDYYTARKKYFSHLSDNSARQNINKRFRNIAKAGYLYPIAYYSERRKNDLGGADLAYTLTEKGKQLLEEYLNVELTWDSNRKYRKPLFITHHLNILYFTSLYKSKNDYKVQFVGEASGKFQVLGKDKFMKDFIKPDAILFFEYQDYILPWNIEYERHSRQSNKKLLTKFTNHANYAEKGMYKQHEIMSDFDVNVPPIFFIYTDNDLAYKRRLNILKENKLNFYNLQNNYYYSDIIWGFKDEVEEDPEKRVFKRFSGEELTFEQVNLVQIIAQRFIEHKLSILPSDFRYRYFPSYLILDLKTKLDGVINIAANSKEASYLFKYFPEHYDWQEINDEIEKWLQISNDLGFSKQKLLKESLQHNKVNILLIVDNHEQENELLKLISTKELGKEIANIYVTQKDLIINNEPYSEIWKRHGLNERSIPLN